MASSLSLSLHSQYNGLLEIYLMWLFLRCVCWDPMNCEFMSRSIHDYYSSLFWTLLCMTIIAFYFFSKTLVWFGQLDWFFLQWEEVLCDVFDLAVLNLSDRRRSDTHVSLLLRIKRWVYTWIDLVYIMSSFLLHYPVLHELNTLDACWIAVDVWSRRCR